MATRLPTAQRRIQIAEAALKILAAKGASGLTLVEIGNAVGIADASVLRHFKDKRAIVAAAIALFGELLNEDLPEPEGDPLERLGAFIVQRLRKIRARPELMGLAYNARLRDAAGPEGAAAVNAAIGRSAQFIRGCIDDARAAGQISERIPTQMWVWAVVGLLRGGAMALPGPLLSEDLVAGMTPDAFWDLIKHIMQSA